MSEIYLGADDSRVFPNMVLNGMTDFCTFLITAGVQFTEV